MVERSLSMREVRGSIPCISKYFIFSFFKYFILILSEKVVIHLTQEIVYSSLVHSLTGELETFEIDLDTGHVAEIFLNKQHLKRLIKFIFPNNFLKYFVKNNV